MKKTSSRLSVERLENRELFAGDIAAYVDASGLHLNGDYQANAFEIHGIGNHNYVVNGMGTTVNHASSNTFHVVNDKIFANLNGGDDYMYLHDSNISSISFVGGDGNDDIYVKNVTAATTLDGGSFDMGKGNDRVYLENDHFFGNLFADLGDNDDYISFKNTHVDNLMSVLGGSGTDSYSMDNATTIGKLWTWGSIEKRV
jgi:hypothetical protein